MDGGRCLARGLAANSQRLGTRQARRPVSRLGGQRFGASGFWGGHTGPNPTDRRKNGCKRHLITDAAGLPLTLITTAANVPDGKMAITLLDAIPPIRGPVGRPRFRPGIYQGDRAYGWKANIRATRERGVRSLLARPMDDTHGSGLGKTRHFVEGTLSWFNNHRRIRLCYERSNESFLAFNQLAAILICHRKLAAADSS